MNYLENAPIAIAGMRLRSTPEDVRSLPLSGEGVLSDGDVVAISEDGKTCKAVASGDTDFGIVVFHHVGKTGKNKAGEDAYKLHDVVPVMVAGRIWVEPAEAITARGKAAKVYVTTDGKLSATAESNTELVGAHWDSLTSEDGLAIVNLG